MKSICIYCGCEKIKPLDACNYCGKTPVTKSHCIQSIILSFDEKNIDTNFIERDSFEYYSNEIKNKKNLNFDKNTLEKAEKIYNLLTTVTNYGLFKYFIKLFWPIIPITIFLLYYYVW